MSVKRGLLLPFIGLCFLLAAPTARAQTDTDPSSTCIVCDYPNRSSTCLACLNLRRDGWWMCRTNGCNKCTGTSACTVTNPGPTPLSLRPSVTASAIDSNVLRRVASFDIRMAVALDLLRKQGETLRDGGVTMVTSVKRRPLEEADIEHFLSPETPAAKRFLRGFDRPIKPAYREISQYRLSIGTVEGGVEIRIEAVSAPSGRLHHLTLGLRQDGPEKWVEKYFVPVYQ